MKNVDKILIFGGGMLQISIIQTAKRLGYNTIVIDPDPKAFGKEIADEFIVVPGNDFEKTYEIAVNNKIRGVVTAATDKPLLMMSRIAEKLKLPFPSEAAIYNTINKFEFKKTLVKNKIPCAKGVLTNPIELSDDLRHSGIKFPLIVKPIDNSGSRGVYYCKTMDEFVRIFPESIKYSNFDKVLIEEYLEGPEISIEALVQDNNLNIIQITDKTITPFPYNVEMEHLQPSRFYSDYYSEIYLVLNNAAKVLNLNNCALHPEIKITKDGIKIVEIGPRLGGDFITSHLTPLSTGINIEEQLVKIAVGEEINVARKTNRYSAVLYFDFLNNPINVNRLNSQIKNLKNNISAFKVYYDDFSDLPVITNSLERHGHVVFYADSLEELLFIKGQLKDVGHYKS